eukprot:gene6695-2607_t
MRDLNSRRASKASGKFDATSYAELVEMNNDFPHLKNTYLVFVVVLTTANGFLSLWDENQYKDPKKQSIELAEFFTNSKTPDAFWQSPTHWAWILNSQCVHRCLRHERDRRTLKVQVHNPLWHLQHQSNTRIGQ